MRIAPCLFVPLMLIAWVVAAEAQSVGLPAPRLLTTKPMGGKVGTQVEIVIAGEFIEDAAELTFSDPRLSAAPKLDANGHPEANKYVVTIAADCPVGVYDARVMTRLGLSTSRAFAVGALDEVQQSSPNTTLATAIPVGVGSVVNGVTSGRAVDHYTFDAKKDQRIVVDCAARGIDSKLDPTVIVADAAGRDLLVERRGQTIDFTVPADGKYVVKVHDLTFKGGHEHYYRLGIWEQPAGTPIVRQPATKTVNSFSWPPVGSSETAAVAEVEPNDEPAQAQKISLPCDIAGNFAKAADVDIYEFESKKGDEWWVEVGSERFGLPTDPSVLVQQVVKNGDGETVTDIAEFSDIPSPVKISSNGYAYDGPPYNAGTSDVLGKLVIKEDGLHRIQISDLFGGTRSEPRHVYRLVVRKASPDFAVVMWAMHMELRNGDRNALSKPIALRGGATMALEVVAIRRDGFDGEIELGMEGLPNGVTAHGVRIPAGQSRGMMLVSASPDAPRSFASAKCLAKATINNEPVTRPCRLASFAWPIPDSWGEIPYPRLLADVPVSVSGNDLAPLSLAVENKTVEAVVGQKITIPFTHVRRSEFSGGTFQFKAVGVGFERVPPFDISLAAEKSEAVLDLATLKTPPGEYTVAFLGGAVAKYRHNVGRLKPAEESKQQATQAVATLEAEVKRLTDEAAAAAADKKADAEKVATEAKAKLKAAQDALNAANEQLKKITDMAQPRDIVDIIVSDPVTIRVKPAESK